MRKMATAIGDNRQYHEADTHGCGLTLGGSLHTGIRLTAISVDPDITILVGQNAHLHHGLLLDLLYFSSDSSGDGEKGDHGHHSHICAPAKKAVQEPDA